MTPIGKLYYELGREVTALDRHEARLQNEVLDPDEKAYLRKIIWYLDGYTEGLRLAISVVENKEGIYG